MLPADRHRAHDGDFRAAIGGKGRLYRRFGDDPQNRPDQMLAFGRRPETGRSLRIAAGSFFSLRLGKIRQCLQHAMHQPAAL